MDDHISRIEAALEAGPTQIDPDLYGDRYFAGEYSRVDLSKAQDKFVRACTTVAIRALLDRLKAAEAENERLRKALTDVIADLEHEGGDGWMIGQVHADEYKAARAALREANNG